MSVACHLVTPLPVHRDSREQDEAFDAWCCEECEAITSTPIRSHSRMCSICHWEKALPPRTQLRADSYLAPGRCPDCGFKGLKYATRFLCRECKGELQPLHVRECHCGALVPAGEFADHQEACQ